MCMCLSVCECVWASVCVHGYVKRVINVCECTFFMYHRSICGTIFVCECDLRGWMSVPRAERPVTLKGHGGGGGGLANPAVSFSSLIQQARLSVQSEHCLIP